MEKDFFDVFPNLKVKKELEELLEMVTVTRVSCNPSKTHIWVYIKSERWIHKKHIFELENQIERQLFSGLELRVTVIEKFRLSRQYTPENFLKLIVPVWNWNCAAITCLSTICSNRHRLLFRERMICV